MECSYTYPPFHAALSGLPLKTMLEIGSLHGLDAIEVKKTYALERVITIECNPECIEICKRNFQPDPNITLVEVAAWHEDGTIPFFPVVASHDLDGKPTHNIGASSCFESNGMWLYEEYTQKKIEVPARRLDGVLAGLNVPCIDLICMDAQGAELYALQGLGKYLDGVQAIITELEIKPMYHGQKLFDDVRAFLEERGFQLAAQNRWAPTAGDFLFLKAAATDLRREPLAPSVTVFTDEELRVACSLAQRHAIAGRAAAAQSILDSVLKQRPDFAKAHLIGGLLAEAKGNYQAAVVCYEAASASDPGQAFAFTRRAILKLRLGWGDPAAPLARNRALPFVMMSELGTSGRLGAQLLQYAMLRIYAAKTGAQVIAPDWIGRDLFGLNDATPNGVTPKGKLGEEITMAILGGKAPPQANVDLQGFFVGSTVAWADRQAEFRRWFTPVGKAREAANKALRKLLVPGKKLVAMHVRRGDFGRGKHWLAPSAWYREWLAQFRDELGDAVIFLASDDPAVAAEFADWPVVTAAALGPLIPGVECFTDHWVLRNADWLATSNSAFSVTAALLNEKRARCFRPDRTVSGLREFNPWAEPVLLD